MKLHRLSLAAALSVAAAAACVPADAAQTPPAAYQRASTHSGVPVEVLYAVALQESGVSLRGRLIPWPWTLNVAGQAQRFANRTAACEGLGQALAEHAPTRIDVGLGQVNLGWQQHRYEQPCDLLDPYRNLAVVAQILREHASTSDNWITAIGRYHRPAGGAPADLYRNSVAKHLRKLLSP
jgi:soluble lytic murein transglycosylase-like protein